MLVSPDHRVVRARLPLYLPDRVVLGLGTGQETIPGAIAPSEGMNAATMLALSGALIALVAKGDAPLSLKRVVAQTLSNPIPAEAADTRRYVSVSAPPRQVAP